ncbi:hypothetical protein BDY19DRAFT_998758 [Irpex rosettiformis]|uniref:Uncharacterized protein n=1 Tax=Irpex rosettiformis TaxID=378272 RepID=A0ACB8TMJ4_9APHY|nr:hypothetical protein BDY19DRAFT_998758 [Irpex rosettiformis]
MSENPSPDVPSYKVEPKDPRVYNGIEPFDIEGRNPALPPMFRYIDGIHPQLRNRSRQHGFGAVYVYLVDSSPDGRTAFQALASKIGIPSGQVNQPGGNPQLRGLLVLNEGDAVFARDIREGGKVEEDILQVLIATRDEDESILSKRQSLAACRDSLMGPQETRDGRRVWFEQQNRAKEVKGETRCYGLSNMVERPVTASGPPASLKVINGQLDAVQLAVKETVRASADYNMSMWERMAPDSLRRVIEAYAELTNMPRIGTYDNYMWSSFQLNLAEPQRVGDEQPLGITNGRFGDSHVDSGDSPTHLSCATVLSDIPSDEGWEPGRMHFLGVGCYTTLEPFKQFFFTGLQLHGSTRPLVPDSFKIPRWACRAMLISYPSRAFALGEVKHHFGLMPGKKTKTFYLSPDMYGGIPRNPPDCYYTTHASTAQDGSAVMDDASLVNFHARGLLSWVHWTMEFLPSRLQIEVDTEKFLSAFTYRDGVNGRVGLKSWPMAPSSSVNEPYEDRHVDAQIQLLHTLYDRMAKGIPDLPPNPYDAEYLTNRGRKVRPDAYKPSVKKLKALPVYDEYKSEKLPPRPTRKSKRQLNKKRPRNQRVYDSDEGSSEDSSPQHKRLRVSSSAGEEEYYGYNLRSSIGEEKAHSRYLGRQFSSSDSEVVQENVGTSTNLPIFRAGPSCATGQVPYSVGENDDLGREEIYSSSSSTSDMEDSESTSSISTGPVAGDLCPALPVDLSRVGEVPGDQVIPATPPSSGECVSTMPSNAAQHSLLPPTPVSPTKKHDPHKHVDEPLNTAKVVAPREEVRRMKRINEFCDSIGVESFKENLKDVLTGVGHIHAMRLESLIWSTSSLDKYQRVAQPFRMNPDDLSKYMSAFSVAKHQDRSNEIWSRIIHQRIILHEYRLARAITDIENILCSEIFAQGAFLTSPSNWIERLLRDIHVKLVLKKPMDVSSQLYLLEVGSPRICYSEPEWAIQERSWTRNRPSDAEFLRRTAIYLGRILRCWFDLPGSYLTRGRAHLVDVLAAKFGEGVLYLPQTWILHQQLPRFIYRNPPHDYHSNLHNKDRPYEPSAMEDFVRALNAVNEKAVVCSRRLANFYASYLRLVEAFTRQLQAERTVATYETVDPPLPCGVYDRRRNVVELCRDTIAVLEHLDGTKTLDLFTAPQQALFDNLDSRICAREFAPSRRLMSKNVDKAFMRTRAGLFSALVFRNISFNTKAFLNCPNELAKFMFEDIDKWNEYIAALRNHFPNESEDFFCNKFALGQPIAERTAEQAGHFWEVSQNCEWPEARDWPVKFMDMYNCLSRIKASHTLPGCGSLSLYLLCADMFYYDLVEIPTYEEMSSIICSLGKGALSGLILLGYLEEGGTQPLTVEAVKTGFKHFSSDLNVLLLSAPEVPYLNLSTIDLEHILCKFSRMWTLKHYRSAPPL